MKSVTTTVGIILIVLGILGFAYQQYSYNSQEQVAQFGNIQVTAETKKTVYFPPLLGGGLIAAGVILVIVGNINRKS
jgi:uncharacterized membrane protein